MTIEQRRPLNAKVLAVCGEIMERNGLTPFDRDGNRHFYWFISPELVEHEWRDDTRNEIAGIPVLLAPRGGSVVEILRWVDGANVPSSVSDSMSSDEPPSVSHE